MLPLVAAFLLIKAGPLARSVDAYVQSTGILVIYPYADLKGVITNEVECDCGPIEGMRRLIWGTHAWIGGIHRGNDGRIESISLAYRPCLFRPKPSESWEELRCGT